MTTVWAVIVALALINAAIKTVPAVALRGNRFAPRVETAFALLPAALLAALVTNQSLTSGNDVVADARIVGVLAAAVALVLRACGHLG
jgi:branched-subunit amino acid transport protein